MSMYREDSTMNIVGIIATYFVAAFILLLIIMTNYDSDKE